MENTTLILFRIIIRIIAIIICVHRAGKLNRNKFGWGIFGFIFPLPAVIWIYCLKIHKNWVDNPTITDTHQ